MVSSWAAWARCSSGLVRQWHTLVETQRQQAGQRRERSGDLCGSRHAVHLQRFHPHHDGDEEGEHRREVDEGYGEGGGGVLPAIEGVLRERRAKHGAEEEVRQDLQCELGPRAPFFEKGYWSREDGGDQLPEGDEDQAVQPLLQSLLHQRRHHSRDEVEGQHSRHRLPLLHPHCKIAATR